jgi:hypothetical protein
MCEPLSLIESPLIVRAQDVIHSNRSAGPVLYSLKAHELPDLILDDYDLVLT